MITNIKKEYQTGDIVHFIGKKRKWVFTKYDTSRVIEHNGIIEYYCTLSDPNCARLVRTYCLPSELEKVI